MSTGFLSRMRRFARASGGLAALEFALIAPMMVFLLFGAVELIDALGANRRAQNAASSLADVVARDTEVTDDEMTGLWAALDILMYPDTATAMKACITHISYDTNSAATVRWSENRNNMSSCPVAAASVPAAMRVANSSVVIASTSYNYTPPLTFFFDGAMNLNHTVYRRSRVVDPIPRLD